MAEISDAAIQQWIHQVRGPVQVAMDDFLTKAPAGVPLWDPARQAMDPARLQAAGRRLAALEAYYLKISKPLISAPGLRKIPEIDQLMTSLALWGRECSLSACILQLPPTLRETAIFRVQVCTWAATDILSEPNLRNELRYYRKKNGPWQHLNRFLPQWVDVSYLEELQADLVDQVIGPENPKLRKGWRRTVGAKDLMKRVDELVVESRRVLEKTETQLERVTDPGKRTPLLRTIGTVRQHTLGLALRVEYACFEKAAYAKRAAVIPTRNLLAAGRQLLDLLPATVERPPWVLTLVRRRWFAASTGLFLLGAGLLFHVNPSEPRA